MNPNGDCRTTKLESHPSAGRGRIRRATARRSLLLALVLAGAQAGCDGERSPTAPLVPESEQRQLRVEGPFTVLLISPAEPGSEYPGSGELLLDGSTMWTGPIGEPYGGYYSPPSPANVVVGRREVISPGSHTLTFRVLGQRASPTEYLLSGNLDVYFYYEINGTRLQNEAVRTLLRWQDVPVRLRTGAAWSIDFVVPDSIPPS